jgi:hypothetical protein
MIRFAHNGRLSTLALVEKQAVSVEHWAVNKSVHYNSWANFGRKDLEPVVASFKELTGCFRCVSCDSWIYADCGGMIRSEILRSLEKQEPEPAYS